MKSPWQLLAGAGRFGRRGLASLWRRSIGAARGALADRRLVRDFPFLKNYDESSAAQRQALLPLYQEYVTTVSTAKAAISLELAVFLAALCQARRPRRILDLGSGFSSLVLRTYAAAHQGAVVVSVDDAPLWFTATQAYLRKHAQSIDQVLLWDDFTQQTHAPFDLVLHDLGDMTTRQRALPLVLGLLSPAEGLIVLDDMHKPHYASFAKRQLGERRFRTWNLHRYTADAFGRYAVLAQLEGART